MSCRQIVVLQHEEVEGLGSIGTALERAGVSYRCVRAHAGDAVPSDLGGAAGLIVMGGPMGVYDAPRYPFLRHEMRLIENAVSSDRPVLGICLGSQLLAHVLGATVRASGKKEIGWHDVVLTADGMNDPLFAGVGTPLRVFQWHGDIFSLPPGATHLATSSFTPVQAFRHGQAYGMLFHLEATREIVAGMVSTWPEELAEERLDGSRIIHEGERFLPGMEATAGRVFGAFVSTISTSSIQSRLT